MSERMPGEDSPEPQGILTAGDAARTEGSGRAPGGEGKGMGRRAALKVLASTAAALPVVGAVAACAPGEKGGEGGAAATPGAAGGVPTSTGRPTVGPRGTPSDPDLLNPKITWEMQLTAAEMATLTALCDMIIPADEKSPSASQVGVPAYINEYVSAPADWYKRALVQVRGGLAWINVESTKRFGKAFHEITDVERTAICDDICYAAKAKPAFKQAAKFFDRVRDLTAEGFYTTDAGMKDIGYVGNVALATFDGPPPEVMRHLGLA
ncbi:MAG: gluconate 2-dehydrogenase subunit 3 family protein [Gemmatimonadaceae bacterium]|nr:gluconate 2-dehydrogenase subunit 3 family protein [Gemmatimonadaceae bacterium]